MADLARSIRCSVFSVVCATVMCGSITVHADLKELLSKYPAKSPEEQSKLSAEILKRDAAKELCTMLVPKSVNDDKNVRYALHGLAWHTGRQGAEEEAKQYTAVLINALQNAQDKDVKAFLIRQLELVADNAAVSTLGGYLTDEQLCNPAARALITIGTAEASAELLKAMPKTKGRELVEIINALGSLHVTQAVSAIEKHADNSDRDTRIAAMYALAHIGEASSEPTLRKGMQTEAAYEQARVSSFYFTYLSRLAKNGDEKKSEKKSIQICRELLGSDKPHIQCSAISTLAAIAGDDASSDILAAAKSSNSELRVCALKLTLKLKSSDITKQLADSIAAASPEQKIELLDILAQRGDASAMPEILLTLKDSDSSVRRSAILASVKLQSVDAVPELLALLKNTTDKKETELIQGALPRIRGEKVMALVADELKESNAHQKINLLSILASDKAAAHNNLIFDLTKDEDSDVRAAAIKAFGFTAGENDTGRLITLTTDMTSSREQSAVQAVLVSVLKLNKDNNKAAQIILTAMKDMPAEKKSILVSVLQKLGGKAALTEIVAGTKSSDEKLQITCVRALAGWSTFEASDALLDLTKSSDSTAHQVLALRGYLKLLENEVMDSAGKVRLYQDAAALVKRPDEQRMIIAELAKLSTPESLSIIATYLDNDEVKSEVALAVAQIVMLQRKNKQILNKSFLPAFQQALPLITDEKMKSSLKKSMKRIRE